MAIYTLTIETKSVNSTVRPFMDELMVQCNTARQARAEALQWCIEQYGREGNIFTMWDFEPTEEAPFYWQHEPVAVFTF